MSRHQNDPSSEGLHKLALWRLAELWEEITGDSLDKITRGGRRRRDVFLEKEDATDLAQYTQENGDVLVRRVGQRLFDQKKELRLREWKDEARCEIKRQRPPPDDKPPKPKPPKPKPPKPKPPKPKGGPWNHAWGAKPEDVGGGRQDGRYGHGVIPWDKWKKQ